MISSNMLLCTLLISAIAISAMEKNQALSSKRCSEPLHILTNPDEIETSTRLINTIAFFNKHMNDNNFKLNIQGITPTIINGINPLRKLSPLTLACRSANIQDKSYMAKLLLKLGGNPLVGYPSPVLDELLAARCINKYKIAQECARATDSLPHLAATCCYEKIAQILDQVKPTQPKDIEHSLMMFVKYGSLGDKDAVDKTAVALIAHGANPNAFIEKIEQTYLMLAVSFGILTRNTTVIESLLMYGGYPAHAETVVQHILESIHQKDADLIDTKDNVTIQYCYEVENILKKYY